MPLAPPTWAHGCGATRSPSKPLGKPLVRAGATWVVRRTERGPVADALAPVSSARLAPRPPQAHQGGWYTGSPLPRNLALPHLCRLAPLRPRTTLVPSFRPLTRRCRLAPRRFHCAAHWPLRARSPCPSSPSRRRSRARTAAAPHGIGPARAHTARPGTQGPPERVAIGTRAELPHVASAASAPARVRCGT